jgi:hypothetical protein
MAYRSIAEIRGRAAQAEIDVAKVGVERSNRFTRSSFLKGNQASKSRGPPRFFRFRRKPARRPAESFLIPLRNIT